MCVHQGYTNPRLQITWANFIPRRQTSVGPQCFMPPQWRPDFWGGSYILFNVDPLGYTSLYNKTCIYYRILCFVDRASLYNLVNKSSLVNNFPCKFISTLYMFRATMCPSSGKITVSMRHPVFVSVCGWPSGMQDGMKTRSSTQSDKYQVSHWYSNFSWWWAHSCPKHVKNINKHTRKIVHQVGFIYKTVYITSVTTSNFLTL